MTGEWIPQIDPAKCTGCSDCIAACPTGALGWQAGKAALLRPEACTYCALCEEICPAGAIELPYLILRTPQAVRAPQAQPES